MSYKWQQGDLASLQQEIRRDGYRKLLQRLQKQHPMLGPFASWAEVMAFMHLRRTGGPEKDEILRAVFEAYREDGDFHWEVLLLAICWPRLEWVHARRWRWELDENERWANVLVAFHRCLARVRPRDRSKLLVLQILNCTDDRLRTEYRRRRRRNRRARSLDASSGYDADEDADLEPIPLADWDRGREEAETRIDLDMELKLLRQLWRSGRIPDLYFPVLLATRIYGKSIEEYAQDAEISYDAAKRRRLRAEAIWRRLTRKIP